MIFTMDVGNTNIKTALFEGREMRNYWRISTNTSYTSDEYGLILEGLFARAGLSLDAVEGIVMSSVVPTINFTLEHMCKNYFGKMPMTVRQQYEKMLQQPNHAPNLEMLIENFDKALAHPDAADLDQLRKKAAEVQA